MQARDDAGDAARQTFILADLAGYAALTEAHGDEQAADAAAAFFAAVRALLDDYDAEEVKSIGDALLIRVGDPGGAVRLAARIVAESGAHHRLLGVRVGMDTGSAVRRDGDWFGAAVNLAARVAGAARAGEVLLTGATRTAAGDALAPEQVEARGAREFHNIRHPVEIVALVTGEPESGRLPVDPVCRMAVDPERSRERAVHQGVEYRFCSTTCAAAFAREPERYVG